MQEAGITTGKSILKYLILLHTTGTTGKDKTLMYISSIYSIYIRGNKVIGNRALGIFIIVIFIPHLPVILLFIIISHTYAVFCLLYACYLPVCLL